MEVGVYKKGLPTFF